MNEQAQEAQRLLLRYRNDGYIGDAVAAAVGRLAQTVIDLAAENGRLRAALREVWDNERELRRIDSRNEARQAWLDEQEPDD
jgi:Flp pilus assembly protein CpaB